ncbi:MAG: protein kinase domain-containing protein [Gaiellaceae bacterium]
MGALTVGGRYRIERPLGHGGMASVYLGRDTELERPVAIKLLAENLAGDDEFRRRFVREARLAARLSDPNIVSVYDAGENDGRPYIVMEHVDGETFAELLARRGRLAPDEASELAAQAASGLAHAHQAGLVHRDIKPQNLILRRDGTVKIADFGIARAAETTSITMAGTVLGTAAYLAPEQAMGEEVTAAADVYSLGAVLYELLTGRPPFEFETLADLADQQGRMQITPVRELAPEVPPELEDVVMRCLARNPAYRPASAGELARLLSGGEAPTQPLQRPTAVQAPARRVSGDRRKLWLALAVVVALAAILLAVILAGRGSHSSSPPTTPAAPAAVQPGANAQQQARNLSLWLKRYTGP